MGVKASAPYVSLDLLVDVSLIPEPGHTATISTGMRGASPFNPIPERGECLPNFFSRRGQKRPVFVSFPVLPLNDAHNCRSERTKAPISMLMPTSFRVVSVTKSVLSCPLVTPSDLFRGLCFGPMIRLG